MEKPNFRLEDIEGEGVCLILAGVSLNKNKDSKTDKTFFGCNCDSECDRDGKIKCRCDRICRCNEQCSDCYCHSDCQCEDYCRCDSECRCDHNCFCQDTGPCFEHD